MSKVPNSLKETEYNAGAYLSLTEFVGHYGLTDNDIEAMEGALVIRWKDWVNNANRTVETALYKYNDNIPILKHQSLLHMQNLWPYIGRNTKRQQMKELQTLQLKKKFGRWIKNN